LRKIQWKLSELRLKRCCMHVWRRRNIIKSHVEEKEIDFPNPTFCSGHSSIGPRARLRSAVNTTRPVSKSVHPKILTWDIGRGGGWMVGWTRGGPQRDSVRARACVRHTWGTIYVILGIIQFILYIIYYLYQRGNICYMWYLFN